MSETPSVPMPSADLSLIFAAPDWSSLDTLARREEPAVLWSVGYQSLAAHWLDYAVRLRCKRVTLYCPDRPSAVRTALEGGAYWSLDLDLRPFPPPADLTCEVIDHLPGKPKPSNIPTNGATLVRWWLDLNIAWLNSREHDQLVIDSSREPGGWIGPKVTLAPGVKLQPPYWIGAGTLIGADCTIGPEAIVGPGCILSNDVHVETSLVLGGTFVGAHLDLHHKLLLGATLLDPVKAARVDLTDDFLAAAMHRHNQSVPVIQRILAFLLWLPARLLSLGQGPFTAHEIGLSAGKRLILKSGIRGCLLARRARWLDAVIAGKLRLVGILPRAELPSHAPFETRTLLANTTPGVFSLADVHGAHSPQEPDELAHALYQAALPDGDRSTFRALLKLCLTQPS